MYRRAMAILMCILLLCGNASAVSNGLTDYGNALRLADLLSEDGTHYQVTFEWENAVFTDGQGMTLTSPHVVEVPIGATLSGYMPVLAGNSRVTWKNPNGEIYTEASIVNSNTYLTASVWNGYRITLIINGETYEIITEDAVTEAQLVAADGTDFSRYSWLDEAGQQVTTLLGYQPNGDVTLTAVEQNSGTERTINCMVCLNGTWVQVGTINRLYGPEGGRYYLTGGQLAAVYGKYGFDVKAYEAAGGETWFGHAEVGSNGHVWTDGGTAWVDGRKVTLIFRDTNSAAEFNLYYMPGTRQNNVTPEAAKENNRIWTVSATIPQELESELGKTRVLAYVPGCMANDASFTTTIELPRTQYVTWSWSGGASNTQVVNEEISQDGSTYTVTLSGIHQNPIVFTPRVNTHNVVFVTDKGTYTYTMPSNENLGAWVKQQASTVIGKDAVQTTGEDETRTFGELDWLHLNGSMNGTILSPNWAISDSEPMTLELSGLPRERTLVFRANGGVGSVTVDLVTEPAKLSEWLAQNRDREIVLDNGVVIQLGRFIWADAENNVPISADQDIDLSSRRYGVSIMLTGTHRTYYTVTLHIEHQGDTDYCTVTKEVELNQNLIDWLELPENAVFIIDEGSEHAGDEVKREDYRYTLGNTSDPIPQYYTVTQDISLYAHKRSYVGVHLEQNAQSIVYPATMEEGYELGMPLLLWVEAHASDSFNDGTTVHDYIWSLNGQKITSYDVIYNGTDDPIQLSAELKKQFSVSFDAGEGRWSGQAPNSMQLRAGDYVSESTLEQLSQQLQAPDGQRFTGWVYLETSATDGTVEVPFTSQVRVTSDMTVYAQFAVCHEVNFFTDASLNHKIDVSNFENPLYVPHGESIPTDAYPGQRDPGWVPNGQAFRYWVKVVKYEGETHHLVFSVNDPIVEDMNLYPVFTRLVYIFQDSEGKQITSTYWGEEIYYIPQETPEGKYYVGLRVGDAIIPNGTLATIEALTSLGVILPSSSGGSRIFTDVEPVFADQNTVVYHADADSVFAAGQTDEEKKEQRQTVDAQFTTLGMADIYRVTNASGLVLSGWALAPDGEVVYDPGETVLSDSIVWNDNGMLDLYPVWVVNEDAVVVTFATNYPHDALDANGQLLENTTYQTYVTKDFKPVLPYIEQTGFEMPSNALTVDGETFARYSVAGWSIHPSGEQSGDVDGVYSEGTQYARAVTADTTFYLRWLDQTASAETTTAYFFIRDDGSLPQEPGMFNASNYYPKSATGSSFTLGVQGALKVLTNVVNDTQAVSANLADEPSNQQILDMLRDYPESVTLSMIEDLELSDWYVEWYAIKKDESGNWHVDGRVRIKDTYRLDYFPNGGSNVPMGTTHNPNDWATVSFKNDGLEPQRLGYHFLGWSEDSTAVLPDSGLEVTAVNPQLLMNMDRKLYAVWAPDPIQMPAIFGEKYMRTINGEYDSTELYKGHADTYSITISVESAPVEIPESVRSLRVNLDADGRFSIPGNFNFTSAGTYVFAITENIPADADPSVAYDTATYRLTVYITQTVSGLEIAAAQMARNDIKVEDFVLNNAEAAFQFTNVLGLRDVTVRKVWDDSYNAHNLRPENLTVYLKADNEVKAEAVLNAGNGWEYTFKDMPTIGQNGKAIEYYVEEAEFDNDDKYTVQGTGEVNTGFVITNTYKIETEEITVIKQWQDNDNAAGKRPDNLAFYLITLGPGDGELDRRLYTMEADANGAWIKTIQVPKTVYSGSGVMDVTYTVEEILPDGYVLVDVQEEEVKSADGSTVVGHRFTLTNVETAQVQITKTITGTMGDVMRKFDFTAELYNQAGENVALPQPTGANAGYTVENGVAHFQLGDGESVMLEDLISGAGYRLRISETNSDDYAVSYVLNDAGDPVEVIGGSFSVDVHDGLAVEVINHKDASIDTGLDVKGDRPMRLLIISAICLAAVCIGIRRRKQRFEIE